MSKEKKEKKTAAAPKMDEKAKQLQQLIDSMNKDFGEGAVISGDMNQKTIEVLPSGSLTLDLTMGIGGFPLGRIVEIMGPESSGKTTLTLHAIAEAQKAGKRCAFVDVEHALDPKYATAIGVNMKELLFSQPSSAEQAMEIMKRLASSGLVDVIVLDSVAALVPQTELEGDFDKANVGVQARIMSKGLRVLTGELSKNNVLCFFINQYRMKIGVMYGDPRTTSGGESLKYYASMRLSVRPGEKFKDDKGNIIGGELVVKMTKNKMAAPFTECAVPIIYGKGIDRVGDIYTMAKELGVLIAKGAHHYMLNDAGEETKLASSKAEAVEVLRADPKLLEKVDKKVREQYKESGAAGEAASDEDSLTAEPIED